MAALIEKHSLWCEICDEAPATTQGRWHPFYLCQRCYGEEPSPEDWPADKGAARCDMCDDAPATHQQCYSWYNGEHGTLIIYVQLCQPCYEWQPGQAQPTANDWQMDEA